MTLNGWLQIALFCAIILALTKPIGLYMYRVYEGPQRPLGRWLGWLERGLYRACGTDPAVGQTWVQYAFAMLVFSGVSLLVTYTLLRLQHLLPLNPQGFGPLGPDLAFNTAASFTTNTNWQSYGGETTMSYLSQMAALAWHNFTSAAVGIAVAVALARGVTYRPGPEGSHSIGNFWVDLIRGIVYILLPLSLLLAALLIWQGVPQTLDANAAATGLDGGVAQSMARGPVASQLAIKQLGTNGGGFFNANSAHPFENPTPLTNFLEMLAIFLISAGLTYTYGRMARDQRQGWVLFGAMALLFVVGIGVVYHSESQPNPAARGLAIDQLAGNLEGKEVRFGIANSALFATITTDASCGAVNSMHDSFNPLGGLMTMVNIQLGEVIFGGVGAGLYGVLVFVVLSVFIAGLMVGRTPEYLGKKIEAREMKLAALYILIFPFVVLGFSAWAAVAPYGVASLNNSGPHGLSEILYAFSSGGGNNGSAFAGLNANTPFWNTALGIDMLVGRFLMIIPALAIGGALLNKKIAPPSLGTFPTDGALFGALLLGVIVIVGALTYLPALALGPIVEHFLALGGHLV
ncbi:MAG: potassium-transporting ATPase subunit KdpA [bacterium]